MGIDAEERGGGGARASLYLSGAFGLNISGWACMLGRFSLRGFGRNTMDCIRPRRKTSLNALKICDILTLVNRCLMICHEYDSAIQERSTYIQYLLRKGIEQGHRTIVDVADDDDFECNCRPSFGGVQQAFQVLNSTAAATTWETHHSQESKATSLSVRDT